MLDVTIHVDIPAIEHLARVLEGCTITNTVEQTRTVYAEPVEETEQETTGETPQPPEAAAPLSGAPIETEQKTEPKEEQKEEQKAEPERKCTIDQVMKAAAELRDQGKLKAITGMFEEFGIHKLSDLKDEQIQQFAERLRGLGAAL